MIQMASARAVATVFIGLWDQYGRTTRENIADTRNLNPVTLTRKFGVICQSRSSTLTRLMDPNIAIL